MGNSITIVAMCLSLVPVYIYWVWRKANPTCRKSRRCKRKLKKKIEDLDAWFAVSK